MKFEHTTIDSFLGKHEIDNIISKKYNAMIKEDYLKHTENLSQIGSLEKQIEYWFEYLPTKSLFKPLKFEDSKYELNFEKYKNSDFQILLAKEIDRLLANEITSFKSFSILNSFYARYETDNNDLTFLKKQAIKEIKEIVNSELDDLKLRKKGFKAYKGGDSTEIKLKDLSFIFGKPELTQNFKYIYEGYLLAMAEREIKAFEGQRSENTVSTNYIGLFIYAFDLHNNTIFNKLNLGPSDKAKLFAKVFNLGDSQVENLRKAMSSPGGMVSKPFLKWFKQFDIDPKDTELKRFLGK